MILGDEWLMPEVSIGARGYDISGSYLRLLMSAKSIYCLGNTAAAVEFSLQRDHGSGQVSATTWPRQNVGCGRSFMIDVAYIASTFALSCSKDVSSYRGKLF
ncbi:hypothetical protein HAX54_027896 [Datura stramonium]|uniref:Uncharacterized protein n=1 Tax=Datura stramonium TaxID=4076 RepID=A0ABS8V4F6_DATST|nr:hypothetical protein [Datura stramonium]